MIESSPQRAGIEARWGRRGSTASIDAGASPDAGAEWDVDTFSGQDAAPRLQDAIRTHGASRLT
jgi:hypothetical protein